LVLADVATAEASFITDAEVHGARIFKNEGNLKIAAP